MVTATNGPVEADANWLWPAEPPESVGRDLEHVLLKHRWWESLSMQVSVSARHGHLQPGDQELIEEKVAKLRRLYDRVNAIEATVDLEHLDNPSVEIQVSVEHADNCVATADATTVIAALDLAIPKVEQQLRRLKEKKTGHRATRHNHIDTSVAADEE